MERKKVFDGSCSAAKPGILDEIRLYLSSDEGIGEYQAELDPEGNIMVEMILKKFSYLGARTCFLSLAEYMRRSYYNVYECEELEEQVRYLLCTGIRGRDGMKFEVVIR